MILGTTSSSGCPYEVRVGRIYPAPDPYSRGDRHEQEVRRRTYRSRARTLEQTDNPDGGPAPVWRVLLTETERKTEPEALGRQVYARAGFDPSTNHVAYE